MKRTSIAIGLLISTCMPATSQELHRVAIADICEAPLADNACLFRSQPTERFESTPKAMSAVLRMNAGPFFGGVFDTLNYQNGLVDVSEAFAGVQQGWSLDQLLDLRRLLGTPGLPGEQEASDLEVSSFHNPSPEQIDKALTELLEKRAEYARLQTRDTAKAEDDASLLASEAVPTDIEQPSDFTLKTALKKHLDQRAAFGSAPWSNPVALSGEVTATTLASLPTNLDLLLAVRESWGTKPGKVVKAPLAAGVVVPLQMQMLTNDTSPRVDYDLVVNSYPSAPVRKLAQVPARQIDRALEQYLSQRDAWASSFHGSSSSKVATLPTTSVDDVLTARAQWSDGSNLAGATDIRSGEAYATLPTTDVKTLLTARANWGKGDGERIALVPLAKGAVWKFEEPQVSVVARAETVAPIINAAEARAPLKLARVSEFASRLRLRRLLSKRAALGTAPSHKAGTVYASLPTTNLKDLLAKRASWGSAPVSANTYATLPTTDVNHVLAQRAKWSQQARQGPAQATGAAPDVYGAVRGSTAAAASCQEQVNAITGKGIIRFQSASAKLDGSSNTTLSKLAEVTKSCDGVVLNVEGHTDATGSEVLNQKLSEQRAAAVAAFLKDAGVPSARVNAIGLGESKPVVPNTTATNRALNRRIEFKVLAR
ncbi:MAG: OmpA family protein [Pseudomonadota bacterium]